MLMALGDAYGELNKMMMLLPRIKSCRHLKMMKPVLRNFVPCGGCSESWAKPAEAVDVYKEVKEQVPTD